MPLGFKLLKILNFSSLIASTLAKFPICVADTVVITAISLLIKLDKKAACWGQAVAQINRRLGGQPVHPANNFGLPPARGIPDFDGLREAVQTHGCVNPRAADLQQLLDVFHFEQTIIRLSVVVIHRSPHQGHFCPPSHRGAWLNQQLFFAALIKHYS